MLVRKRRKFSEAIHRKVFGKTKGKCYLCHRKMTFKAIRRVHVKPVGPGRWEVIFYDRTLRQWVNGVLPKKPRENARNWHIDHRIPSSRDGTDALENLWPACDFCNRSKHNRTVAEFKADRPAPPCDDFFDSESFCPPFECT